MAKIFEKPLLAIAIFILLCAYLFFFKLGGMALTDPDETFYAQTAKEMLNKGEWHTPYLYGKPQFEKPILSYWLIECSYKLFGINEAAARLPSAVFGLIGVIAIYFLGSLLFDKRAGFLSAIVLATNAEYIILSRACITDMVLTVLMLLGVAFFFYGYVKEKKYFYILSSASFGLAVLTKGPVAIILPAAAFLIFLWLTKDLARLKKMSMGWCIAVFIVVAVPWYLVEYKIYGKQFIEAFFGFQNITRFTQSEHKLGSQAYYNIPVIFVGFLPWSVFLPFGFWHLYNKIRNRQYAIRNTRNGFIFAMIWFFVIFLFFTASSTKLPTYVFPSFISLALIVGVLWNDFLNRNKITRQVDIGVKASYYLLVLLVVAGTISAALYVRYKVPVIFPGIIVSTAILVFGFAIATFAFVKKMYLAAFVLIAASMAIFLYPLSIFVVPQVERYESSKEVAVKLIPMMRQDEALGSQSNYLAGLAFYTGKFPVDIDRHQAMVEFFNSKKRMWAVIKGKNYRDLYDWNLSRDSVKPSYLLYEIGKRAIVTNELPEGVSYILKRELGGQ